MMDKWDSEAVREIEYFHSIISRGYYINGERLTNLYNKIFGTNLKPTNCGSCCRARYESLRKSYDAFKKLIEKAEENKVEEPKITEEKPVVKHRGRPKKKGTNDESTK